MMLELMRILGFAKQTRYMRIRGKADFLSAVDRAAEPYIHISAHGDFKPFKGTWIDLPRRGRLYPQDISELWQDRDVSSTPGLIVMSACETGHVDMVRAFSSVGCKHCIAPLHETYWEDAALFSTMFYKLLVGERNSPWISYKKTMAAVSFAVPRLTGAWSFYEWGEKVISTTE